MTASADTRLRGAAYLVVRARQLLARPHAATEGLWPRAAALLGRQAIETALGAKLASHAPGLERCSLRAQFLCLDTFLRDEHAAAGARDAWGALTRACHHHPYELAPSADELGRWLDAAEMFVRASAASAG